MHTGGIQRLHREVGGLSGDGGVAEAGQAEAVHLPGQERPRVVHADDVRAVAEEAGHPRCGTKKGGRNPTHQRRAQESTQEKG